MKNLTIHQRINFKSHYPANSFILRVKRIDLNGHEANGANSSRPNYKSFDIPFYNELQGYLKNVNVFRNKF